MHAGHDSAFDLFPARRFSLAGFQPPIHGFEEFGALGVRELLKAVDLVGRQIRDVGQTFNERGLGRFPC